MRRVLAGLLAMTACACARAPAHVSAAEAGELLARFAAGSAASPVNVCTPEGLAVLRGAVRAYGAELNANGIAWPALPGFGGAEVAPSSVDASVLVAFAAGFVEASDFHGPARRLAHQLSLTQWPEIRSMREAANVACDEVAALQHATSGLVMEMARFESMAASAPRGVRDRERLARQQARVERARRQMQQVAAFVGAEVEAARRGS